MTQDRVSRLESSCEFKKVGPSNELRALVRVAIRMAVGRESSSVATHALSRLLADFIAKGLLPPTPSDHETSNETRTIRYPLIGVRPQRLGTGHSNYARCRGGSRATAS